MNNKKPKININAIHVYFKIKCYDCAYYHFYSVNNGAYFFISVRYKRPKLHSALFRPPVNNANHDF